MRCIFHCRSGASSYLLPKHNKTPQNRLLLRQVQTYHGLPILLHAPAQRGHLLSSFTRQIRPHSYSLSQGPTALSRHWTKAHQHRISNLPTPLPRVWTVVEYPQTLETQHIYRANPPTMQAPIAEILGAMTLRRLALHRAPCLGLHPV